MPKAAKGGRTTSAASAAPDDSKRARAGRSKDLREAGEARSLSPLLKVVADVRERISLQKILPGARVTEEELADTYGIPRAMAREVLAALEDRGLVTRIPNKGAVVTVLDLKALLGYYELREALDGLAVRLATQKTDASYWSDLALQLGAPFDACLKEGDMDGLVTTIENFRSRLNSAADSPVLSDMSERVHERLRVLRRRVALLPGRAAKSVVHYRALLAAIMSGDADKAERAARELNRSTRADIERYANYVL